MGNGVDHLEVVVDTLALLPLAGDHGRIITLTVVR